MNWRRNEKFYEAKRVYFHTTFPIPPLPVLFYLLFFFFTTLLYRLLISSTPSHENVILPLRLHVLLFLRILWRNQRENEYNTFKMYLKNIVGDISTISILFYGRFGNFIMTIKLKRQSNGKRYCLLMDLLNRYIWGIGRRYHYQIQYYCTYLYHDKPPPPKSHFYYLVTLNP